MEHAKAQSIDLSVTDGDPLERVERAVRLLPAKGTGIARRLLLYPMIAWLPIAAWALITGHALARAPDESLVAHFGIHARLLIAIPLLVIGESVMARVMRQLGDYLISYKLLPDAELEKMRAFADRVRKLRGGWAAWLVIGGLVTALIVSGHAPSRTHEITWAGHLDQTSSLPFGAWWYYYVSRTMMLLLVAAALWRIVLWGALIAKVARLELNLVPNHPDKAMGLAFLGMTPRAVAPFLLAASSLVAATWTHDILYHGTHVKDYLLPFAGLATIAVLIAVLPLLTFVPLLSRARVAALKEYGGLLARQGRQIHGAYIDGTNTFGDDLLDARGVGPAADAGTLYEQVRSSHLVPVTKATFAFALLPVLLPMLFVVTTEVPLKEVLTTLLKALM